MGRARRHRRKGAPALSSPPPRPGPFPEAIFASFQQLNFPHFSDGAPPGAFHVASMATNGTRLLSLLSPRSSSPHPCPVQAQIAGIEQHQRAAQYRQMARFYREEKGAESLRKSSELSEAEKAEGVLLLALPPTQTGGHKRELSLSRQEVTSSTISPLAEGKPFPDIFDADFVEFSLEVAPLEGPPSSSCSGGSSFSSSHRPHRTRLRPGVGRVRVHVH